MDWNSFEILEVDETNLIDTISNSIAKLWKESAPKQNQNLP